MREPWIWLPEVGGGKVCFLINYSVVIACEIHSLAIWPLYDQYHYHYIDLHQSYNPMNMVRHHNKFSYPDSYQEQIHIRV